VLVCDVRAYRRGHAHPGESCHLVGGGPVPVSVAKALAGDAFVKAVIHDGTAIQFVEHLGRHIPAELRTALELGPAPEFAGTTCVEAGCGRHYGLEWDHVDPVAHEGPTSYANLQPRCWPHHRAKTERDRAAGLLDRAERGPPGFR
jgi:5-methylcytosine-specific restriction endonuclease McrA